MKEFIVQPSKMERVNFLESLQKGRLWRKNKKAEAKF